MPSWATLTGFRGGPVRISVSEGKKAKSCIWLLTIPNVDSHWAKSRLRATLSRTSWGYWWMKNWIWACNLHSQSRKPITSWVASKTVWPTSGRDLMFPLCSSHKILTWSSLPSSRTPNTRNMWTCWSRSREGPWYD